MYFICLDYYNILLRFLVIQYTFVELLSQQITVSDIVINLVVIYIFL
jgi:hypothetical protein